LILKKRTFNIGVCIVTFLISMTAGPSRGVRSNGGGVWIGVKEEHDVVHGITWEIGEFGQRIKDILFFCGGCGVRG